MCFRQGWRGAGGGREGHGRQDSGEVQEGDLGEEVREEGLGREVREELEVCQRVSRVPREPPCRHSCRGLEWRRVNPSGRKLLPSPRATFA